jgi:nitrous oxidase accessory protein
MKRMALALTLILALSVSLVVGMQVVKSSPKTIIVPDDYLTMQEAINNALEGDTVYVKKGTYVENPVVNKTVSLVGEDRDTTVIDVTAGLKVERENVTITGLTIYDGWEGIEISANHCNISGNKITKATYGIVLLSSENNSITGNILQSIGNSAAIQLSYSNNNLVNSNYVDSCTEGIQLREGSSNNKVIENTITNCQDVAVRLLGSGVGTKWYDPNGNTIMLNNISNSGCGTTIYGSNNNTISNNNYVNNTFQVSANEDYFLIWGGNVSVNTIRANYWSDYNGTDANGDGIGDTPYIIDANNRDNYPLMKPVPTQNPSTPTPSPTATPNTSPSSSPSPSPTPTPNQEPQQTELLEIILAVALMVIVIGVGLLVYFKKRKHEA